MRNIQAIVVEAHGAPEQLKLKEIPCPIPSAGEVLLSVKLTSVNFADLKARRQPYRHFQAPFVPGFDGVGVIEALGPEVHGLKVGQRVAAYMKGGSYAQKALADSNLCYPLPEEISDQDGAGIGILITAYNALHWAGRVKEGDNILIHAGSGGVGSTSIQLARAAGANKIITTSSNAKKAALCRQLGADHSLDTSSVDFAREVLQLTKQKGVDIILDTIGGETFEKGFECIAPFGRIVIFGHSSGNPGSFNSPPLHRNNISVIGYSSGGFRKANPSSLRPSAQAVLQLLSEGKVKILQGQTFSLSDAPKAHQLFESRQNTGKIFLKP